MSDISSNDWRSPTFRNRVVGQIDKALHQSGSKITKTSVEMENHLYQKAKSRDEYMELLAKLIIHVSELTKKSKPGSGEAGIPQQVPSQGIPPGQSQPQPQPQQQPQAMQDPINALQNLAMQGTSSICPQQQERMKGYPQNFPRMMGHPQAATAAAQMQYQPRHMMQTRPPPNQQKPLPLQRHEAFMQQPPPQQQQQQQQQPPPQQQPQQQQQPPPQQQQQQPPPQQQQQPPQQQQAPPQQQQQPQMPVQQLPVSAPNQLQYQAAQARPMVQSPYMSPQQYGQSPGQPQQPGSVNQLGPVSSPATQSSHIAHSPANLAAPSPNTHIVPSPVSRNNPTIGAPSPGSALNTPGNPVSVGAAQSPEDQAYLEKLKQLSKYIDPLRRMVRRIDTEEDNKKEQSHKMKNLLEILSDPSKRLPMATLLKCEQVLLKMELSKSTPAGADGSSSSSKSGEQHMCQPLLDAVASHTKSPLLNHTLHRTFGPAITALRGQPIRVPSPPPPKKKRVENNKDELPNILQGEIARLPYRFRISLDPAHHLNSKTVHLICKLDDKNLPSVPPVLIKVPENYPYSSPQCDTNADDYTATPFLQGVQNALTTSLSKMPDKFSITTLLDTWEMSVRRMCAPVCGI